MGFEMKELIEILNEAYEKLSNSGDDLVTYDSDSEADHGDGQKCGREEAYRAVIKMCAEKIIKKC